MSINSISNTRIGTCPHGLPMGACPICNGMMSGGAGGTKKAETQRPSGEWSWMKCYIVGQMMANARHNAEISQILFQNDLALIAKNIQKTLTAMQNVLSNIQNNLPAALQKPFGKLINLTLNPLLNVLNAVPKVLEKLGQFMDNVKTQILAVTEKLTAVLGEIKNFIQDKIIKSFKKLKKKLLSFFIFGFDEENVEIDEEMEVFKAKELKKIKNAVLNLLKKEEKEEKGELQNN